MTSSPSRLLSANLESAATGGKIVSRGDRAAAIADRLGKGIVPVDCAAPSHPVRYWLLVDGSFDSVRAPRWGQDRRSVIRQAIDALDAQSGSNPPLRLCLHNTETVIFFESLSKNSFYHPDLRRAVFVNWREEQSVYHFVEEFVHQSVHSVIDEISADGSKFVSCTNGETLEYTHDHMINNASEVFVRFHSLATLALICEALFAWPEAENSRDHAILSGRTSFAFQKLSYDLQYFISRMNSLTPDGVEFLKTCLSLYKSILHRHEHEFSHHDMNEQPYVFDEAAFLRRNAEAADAVN